MGDFDPTMHDNESETDSSDDDCAEIQPKPERQPSLLLQSSDPTSAIPDTEVVWHDFAAYLIQFLNSAYIPKQRGLCTT